MLRSIEALYSSARTLRAHFEVETVNTAIGEVEVERGELFVTRPDRMKWEYRQPEGKLVLLDGTYQWLYLPAERQAFRGRQSEWSSEQILTLLADPGALRERFEVELGTREPESGLAHLRLRPRRPDPDVQSVRLGVEEASGRVASMDIVDGFDNVTRIRFSDLRLDVRIPDGSYRLKLPRGTELLNFQGEPIED